METVSSFFQEYYIQVLIDRALEQKKAFLRLPNCDISQLPAKIGDCIELRKLYLQHNKLTHLPDEIKNISYLEKLTIDFNQLPKFPDVIVNFHNLTELNLSYNPIKTLPGDIKKLVNLEILWVNSCELEELPNELCELKELDTFGARGNSIRSLPTDFYKLNIRWLTLHTNRLDELPERFHLKYLKHVDLNNNCFTKIPPQVTQLRNLLYFGIKKNKIVLPIKKYEHLFMKMKKMVKFVYDDSVLCLNEQDKPKLFEYITDGTDENSSSSSDESDSSDSDWESSLYDTDIDNTSTDSEDDGPGLCIPPKYIKFMLN